MYNNWERDYNFIQSLFQSKNTDNIIQLLKDNDKIPQSGGCFDALKFFISIQYDPQYNQFDISYDYKKILHDRILYFQNALLKLCIAEKENIQNEFNIYKEKHKEVSAKEQLKLEIIKSMLASGVKPTEINIEEVNILSNKFLYDEDTPKLNITFDNFEINEDQ